MENKGAFDDLTGGLTQKSADNWGFHIRHKKFVLIKSQTMGNSDRHNPNTVDQIVNEIISELPLDDRVRTANLDENGLVELQLGLGKHLWQLIENQTEIVNENLMADCIKQSGNETLDEVEAANYILKEIWSRLRETHRLKVVN